MSGQNAEVTMMGMREEEWVAKFATAQPIDHILASPLGTHTLPHTARSHFLTKWHTAASLDKH